ncbi:hypothetical protein [Leptolyngbya sp. FACHB-16]|uniref:hypothetical protein n=1 Tax=unclassified Leptolyngbya TaxID=2650499 RepID=UPI001686BA28|nr:hypothetical protein [Leptolyngbya sp. FACHB-16]MBD2157686.1 hypothetical protein [Leptolyngbya sp. FACHB-16]
MRRFALTCSFVVLSAALLALPAKAQQTSPSSNLSQGVNDTELSTRPTARELSPFNLVSLAYRGHFSEQGIPGYGNFVLGLHTGRIRADDVIQAAVDAGQLSPDVQDSRSYRTAVRQHLLSLRNTAY